MVHAGADPESHLRWLTTEALRDAVSGLRLAPVSIGLQADSWHGSATNEGSGGFVFWPPAGPGTRHLRVIVSTFWEAAWADIELPAPVAAGRRGVAGDG